MLKPVAAPVVESEPELEDLILATSVAANAKNRNKVVPTSSPRPQTKWFLQADLLEYWRRKISVFCARLRSSQFTLLINNGWGTW